MRNEYDKKVIYHDFATNGTTAYKSDNKLQNETSDKITIDIPSNFSGKITIENNNLTNDNNHKNIDKKIFSNNSLLYKNISYNNDELIIKQVYIKKLEEERMKRSLINEIHSTQIKFLMISAGLIILSLFGLVCFYAFNFTFIHPILYIFTSIMGIGWGTTCIATVLENRRGKFD